MNMRSTGSMSTGSSNPIGGLFALGVMAVSIWAVVCAARITLTAAGLLFDVVLGSAASDMVQNVVLSAIAGAFAGVAVGVMRSFRRKSAQLSQSLISALVSKGLAAPTLDSIFWGRVVLSGLVGFLVGSLNGATGIISFPQVIGGSAQQVVTSTMFPLAQFLGGGFGGPGGDGFWAIVFLIFVILIAALFAGIVAGFLTHVLFAAVGGMTKGAARAYVSRILQEPHGDQSGEKEERHNPIVAGMIRGLIVGSCTGILEIVFTAMGVVRFYRPGPT